MIVLQHRIRPLQRAAGGTIDWIGRLNANAGICARPTDRFDGARLQQPHHCVQLRFRLGADTQLMVLRYQWTPVMRLRPRPASNASSQSPTSEAITATVGKLVQQSVQQDGSTPPLTETPASQASNEAAGPPVTATARPDPVLAGPAGQAQDFVAILSNTPADLASNDAERHAGSHEPTNNAGMVTIFVVLALGLVVLGMPIIAKNVTTRRARTIIDRREPARTNDQSHHDAAPSMKGSYLYQF